LKGIPNMRVFFTALIAAAVIATVGGLVLLEFQKSAAVAFATSEVRL
jgi:hypothetical protein